MDTQSNSVVSLTSHKINSQAKIELDGVRRSLSMLSWDLQTQQVLSFAGLPVSESVLAEDVSIAMSSNAAQVGHTTLKELVSRGESEFGLGLEWKDFSTKLLALVNRQKYSIQERDYKEINALVEDATFILGRKPVDVAEFHGAKQRALQDQVASVQREAQMRTQDLQDKNTGLMRSLTDAQAEIAGLHDQNKQLMTESAERIASMTREMAMNQEIFERKASERVRDEANRLKAEFDQNLAQRESDMSMRIREADNKRMLAENRFNEIQIRIDRGELISSEQLRDMEARLEEARMAEVALRNQLLEMNSALTDAQKIAQAMREENGELRQQIESLNNHVGNLELRMRDIIEDKLGSSEFAVLQERLTMVRNEKTQLEQSHAQLSMLSDKQSRALHEMRGRFQQMRQVGREHLRSLHADLTKANELNLALATNHAHAKIMVGILTGVSLTATAALALKSLGII
ncbi:hypothetical protein P5704_025840 (plasmid) [Pseudomonas sp. FeN3W]|nr:hypothetical protein P5704_025840 [Pseudomonas sp. FeN3W]